MPSPALPTTIVTAALAGGPRGNQDHVVVTDHAVALLDGATSWLPQDPARDGGWYARILGAALTTRLDQPDRTVAELVTDAIADVRDRYGLVPGKCPSSTLTIARWDTETIEVYTLGDSPAVVYPDRRDALLVYDDRLDRVGAGHHEAYREHLRAGNGYDARLAELIAELQLAEREKRNRADGYWIAEAEPAAAAEAVTATFPRAEVRAVLIASDGAAADVMDYHRNDWADVLEFLSQANPSVYLRDIHAAEDADYDGRWWPRPKRHDDKSLVWISFA
ncbi:MAG TPA: hypothetical protein VHN80_29740 [Kineosporiaceae bacterium]|jgi:hypothetical protein|nr:hypothetical protein [Kineosporiaceae bacterium]